MDRNRKNDARSAEQELVERCVGGDSGAWGDFVDRYSSLIYYVIRKCLDHSHRTWSQDDLDEIFSKVFLQLVKDDCRTLRTFSAPFQLSGWLAVIVRRITWRTVQVRKGHQPVSLDEEFGRGNDRVPLRELLPAQAERETIADAAAVQQLHKGLSRLKPRDRMLVKLFYLEKKKYREIARIMCMPEPSVGKTLSRALNLLRAEMQSAGYSSSLTLIIWMLLARPLAFICLAAAAA